MGDIGPQIGFPGCGINNVSIIAQEQNIMVTIIFIDSQNLGNKSLIQAFFPFLITNSLLFFIKIIENFTKMFHGGDGCFVAGHVDKIGHAFSHIGFDLGFFGLLDCFKLPECFVQQGTAGNMIGKPRCQDQWQQADQQKHGDQPGPDGNISQLHHDHSLIGMTARNTPCRLTSHDLGVQIWISSSLKYSN
ncbi:MAG: hypothetical protein H7833_11995 [Magnetococcus sp. DMHC-1]